VKDPNLTAVSAGFKKGHAGDRTKKRRQATCQGRSPLVKETRRGRGKGKKLSSPASTLLPEHEILEGGKGVITGRVGKKPKKSLVKGNADNVVIDTNHTWQKQKPPKGRGGGGVGPAPEELSPDNHHRRIGK